MNGVPVFNHIDGSQPNAAKYLQAAGYYTAMIGKWHLGSTPPASIAGSSCRGRASITIRPSSTRRASTSFPGYVTDIITDLAIECLKQRPKDKPFFIMCHHKAPHRNWQPDARHATMCDDRRIPEPPTFHDDYATRTDAAREATNDASIKHLTPTDLKMDPPPGIQRRTPLQEVEIPALHAGLSALHPVDRRQHRPPLKYLDDDGLAQNTIVVYTSDQGFFLGDHGWFDKRCIYEESLRMPFLVRWPGVIKPGSVQKAMALNVDFAPTFLEMAGVPVPGDMQGRSLVPLLQGERPADWRTSCTTVTITIPGDHNMRAHYGVRTETHKLIYFWKKDQWECYDLVKDPEELHNIYGDPAQPAVIADLKKELYRLKKEPRTMTSSRRTAARQR